MGRAISLMQTDNNTTRRKGERVREGRTEISLRKKKEKIRYSNFKYKMLFREYRILQNLLLN